MGSLLLYSYFALRMPYPLLSFSHPPTLGGPSGLRPWHSWRSQWARQARMLAFFHESLQLLLHLAGLDPKPFSLGALLGRFLLGLSQRLLQGCHLGCGPYNKQYNPVISFCNQASL